MLGLDFTDHTLSGATMKAHGYYFCARYLSPDPWKNLTHAEVVEKSAAGVLIVSNWEHTINPANTKAEGVAVAHAAEAQHLSLGGTVVDPIYFSVDENVGPTTKDLYLEGLLSVLGPHRVGVYGGSSLVRHWRSRGAGFAWRTMSTAFYGGSDTTSCQLKQTGGGSVAGHSVDHDESLATNFGGWNLHTHQNAVSVPTQPVPPAKPGAPAYTHPLVEVGKPKYDSQAKLWQQQAHTHWGSNIVVDGYYGAASKAVAENIQRLGKLAVDGVVGPNTWKYTFSK